MLACSVLLLPSRSSHCVLLRQIPHRFFHRSSSLFAPASILRPQARRSDCITLPLSARISSVLPSTIPQSSPPPHHLPSPLPSSLHSAPGTSLFDDLGESGVDRAVELRRERWRTRGKLKVNKISAKRRPFCGEIKLGKPERESAVFLEQVCDGWSGEGAGRESPTLGEEDRLSASSTFPCSPVQLSRAALLLPGTKEERQAYRSRSSPAG